MPVRAEVAVLAAAEKLTIPFPGPDAPLMIVSHEALLVAVQPQVLEAVTRMVPATIEASYCAPLELNVTRTRDLTLPRCREARSRER